MDTAKSVWDSTTIKGAITSIVSVLALIVFKEPMQNAGVGVADIVEPAMALVAAVGSVFAIIGRLTAKTTLVAGPKTAAAMNAVTAAKPNVTKV